jgi:hypothetical protein
VWHDPLLGSVVQTEDAPFIRALLLDRAYLTVERNRRVIDYVREHADLARHESADEMRKDTPDMASRERAKEHLSASGPDVVLIPRRR